MIKNCVVCDNFYYCDYAKEKLREEIKGVIKEGWKWEEAKDCEEFVSINGEKEEQEEAIPF